MLSLANILVLKRKICCKQWTLIWLNEMCSEFVFLNLDSNEFPHNFKNCNLYHLSFSARHMFTLNSITDLLTRNIWSNLRVFASRLGVAYSNKYVYEYITILQMNKKYKVIMLVCAVNIYFIRSLYSTTLFSNSRLYSVERKGDKWMMNWKGCGRKQTWPNLMYRGSQTYAIISFLKVLVSQILRLKKSLLQYTYVRTCICMGVCACLRSTEKKTGHEKTENTEINSL
jgi:hypothetical protein